MKKIVIKVGIKIFFFVLFLVFSYDSLMDYVHGESVFDNLNEYNETLVFPSLTLCPRPKYTMGYLDLERVTEDMKKIGVNMSFKTLPIYAVFAAIQNQSDPSSFVNKYSISKDTLISGRNTDSGIL